jgi:hypothetical protein
MLTEDNRRLIMRNRMGGISAAAIAGAAIVLSLAATPALAQVPGGSYLRTCSDARMFGDRLVAECQTMDGGLRRTVLRDVDRCVGGIANMNGRLTCNYGEPGYGSSLDRDRSSAPSRYYGYPRYYGYGR